MGGGLARNVEIKARVKDLEALERRAAARADRGPTVIHQEDVFFHVSTGRLKLRVFDEAHGELIFYERPDGPGPKTSRYRRLETSDPRGLQDLLDQALGVRGTVRKQRRLYMAGRTRIHLDRVQDLGDFLELEVVLEPGEESEDATPIAEELMAALGVAREDLVDVAYVDLLC